MEALTLKDGFGITMTFAAKASFALSVDPTSITPPGVDGGDKIDATTHTNIRYRTAFSRQLVEITDSSFTAMYDPDYHEDITSLINNNNLITFIFPDASTVAVYGFLKSFAPNEYVEGEGASAEFEIVITNVHSDTGVETGPAYTAGS